MGEKTISSCWVKAPRIAIALFVRLKKDALFFSAYSMRYS